MARFLAVAIFTLAALCPIQAAQAAGQPVPQAASLAQLEQGGSPVLGNPKGDVTIVEFFDYACPYCKALEPRLEAFLRADKKVRLVLKEFPILTPASKIAAQASLAAAAQGRYEPFHVTLMHLNGPLTEAAIFDTARKAGLDLARLRTDMASSRIRDAVNANFALAKSLHVTGTPTLFIGGRLVTVPSSKIDFPKAAAAARTKKAQTALGLRARSVGHERNP